MTSLSRTMKSALPPTPACRCSAPPGATAPQPGVERGREHRFANPARERAFLHAVGFTVGFAGCRVVTHAIRAGRGPFRNLSVGGRHLHHSTPGIIGQILLGYLWTWQIAVGTDPSRRAASRASALAAGLATALTLDEFALWFDLADDYWDNAGRKSIDAVAVFWGLSAMLLTGRGLPRELGRALRGLARRIAGGSGETVQVARAAATTDLS
jgi:hypothetical protein